MSAALQIELWGAAALLPLILNYGALRRQFKAHVDDVGLSVMMVMSYALYNLIIHSPPSQPENMVALSIMDLMFTGIVAAAWVTQPKTYKMVLTILFISQLAIHAAFWLSWPQDGLLYTYKAGLNATFALQLITVGWPGGHALVRRGLAYLSHRWGVHSHARLGSRR